MLYLARLDLIRERASWKFRILLLGALTVLPWLLVLEYFSADALFPAYYVAERYYPAFRVVLPIALFLGAIFVQFLIIELRRHWKGALKVHWLYALFFLILAYFYQGAAVEHADNVNVDPGRSDQSAYMAFAQKAHQTQFAYTGQRNRVPLYPYLQALFYDLSLGDRDFFEQGKRVNIVLSIILLAWLYVVFRKYFPQHRATILTLITAVGLFVFKAGYFTAELLYYTLSFLGLLGLGVMLHSPTLWAALSTGVVLSLAYLTKTSILPTVVLFVAISRSKNGSHSFRGEPKGWGKQPQMAFEPVAGCPFAHCWRVLPWFYSRISARASRFMGAIFITSIPACIFGTTLGIR